MKKLFLLLFFLIIAWGGISYAVNSLPGLKQDIPVVSQKEGPGSSESSETQVGIPQTIRIPTINITSTIESVGQDDKGRMDVPKDADNVAWYSLGYKPGEKGNAALAGHLDKESGEPAVFWDLEKLKPGDTISITDSGGKEYTFSVVETKRYPYDEFPIEKVFGEADKPMLNLITCKGEWNSTQRNYSHRVVVSAQLID